MNCVDQICKPGEVPLVQGLHSDKLVSELHLHNVAQYETVYQRVLLVTGSVKNNATLPTEGKIEVVDSYNRKFYWPVKDSKFKLLVSLKEGANQIRFNYYNLTLTLNLNFDDSFSDEDRVQLVIMVAKDSNMTFDSQRKDEYNGIESAIIKLRMAGYIWQAFIGEQMYKAGLGRRTVRFKESFQPDTLSQTPIQNKVADVVVVRSEYTMEQIRDKDIAQQYNPKPGDPPKDESKHGLYSMFMDALRDHPTGQFKKPYLVAGMILDSQWDKEIQLIRGHAALGGGGKNTSLGMFGSHLTHTWPSCLEQVPSCFLDQTPLDTNYVADEEWGKGKFYHAANIGLGAFLHELGHALGLPHVPDCIMARGYSDLNRNFLCVHTDGSPVPTLDASDSKLHPTNLVKLYLHPALGLPNQPKFEDATDAEIYLTSEGMSLQHKYGIAQYLVFKDDNLISYKQYLPEFPTKIHLDISFLLKEIQFDQRHNFEIEISTIGSCNKRHNLNNLILEGILECDLDFKVASFNLQGKKIFKSPTVGYGKPETGHKFLALLGTEFFPTGSLHVVTKDGSSVNQLVGHITNGPNNYLSKSCISQPILNGRFFVSIDPNSKITAVSIRAGYYIDGIQLHLSNGSTTNWFGGNGGGLSKMTVPENCSLVGFHGFATDDQVFQLGIVYTNDNSNRSEISHFEGVKIGKLSELKDKFDEEGLLRNEVTNYLYLDEWLFRE